MAYHSLCVYLIPLYSSSLPEIGRVRPMIIIEPRRSICSRVSQTKIDILKSCEIQWNPESFNRFQSFSIVINHVQSFRAERWFRFWQFGLPHRRTAAVGGGQCGDHPLRRSTVRPAADVFRAGNSRLCELGELRVLAELGTAPRGMIIV